MQEWFEAAVESQEDYDLRRVLRKHPFNSRQLNIFSVGGFLTTQGRILGWSSLPTCVRSHLLHLLRYNSEGGVRLFVVCGVCHAMSGPFIE